jgi:hypothetical protein
MSKKILIPIVAVVLVTLLAGAWVSTDALAQGKGQGLLARLDRPRAVIGQVMAVSEGQFTIQTKAGVEVTFRVDANTRVRSRDQANLAYEDIRVGLWVGVVAERNTALAGNEKPLARVVILLPEDVDPSNLSTVRGRMVSVDLSGNRFTVEDRQGQKITLSVDADTAYRGEVTNLAGLKEGMAVIVITEKLENGDLLARGVRAGYLPLRVFGEISAVNTAKDEFTLTVSRNSEEVTFEVDPHTLFRSQEGTLKNLNDLKPGMVATVVAKSQAGETYLATLVTAGNRENLPQVDKRIVGRITEIGIDSITVRGRDSKVYTFQITSETRFRSRGNLVTSLADLRQGMVVAVGVKDLGNGQYQAQVILVIPRSLMR